jgi:hypothetical protein
MMSEDRGQRLQPLSPPLLAYYWRMLETHVDHPESRACLVCCVPRCPDYRYAWERIARSGVLRL